MLLDKLKLALPANRVAAASGVIGTVTAFILALVGAVESDTAKAIVASTALVVLGIIVVVFLIGSQRWERRTAPDGAVELLPAELPAGQSPFEPPHLDEDMGVDDEPALADPPVVQDTQLRP